MTSENQIRIDIMTKDVLSAMQLELKMIENLEKGLTYSFGEDAEILKKKSISEYDRKLERNLKVLKVLMG